MDRCTSEFMEMCELIGYPDVQSQARFHISHIDNMLLTHILNSVKLKNREKLVPSVWVQFIHQEKQNVQ